VQNEPSRFLDEIPEQYADRSYAGGGVKNQSAFGFGNTAFNRMNGGGFDNNSSYEAQRRYGAPPNKKKETTPAYVVPRPTNKNIEHTPSADFTPSDTSALKEGQKVEHQKFGFGEVVKMEGSAHNPVATVKFELNGEKKIMLNYAKLRIVE